MAILIIIGLVLITAYTVLAQQQRMRDSNDMMMQRGMGKMMGKGYDGKCPGMDCPMHKMMGGCMMMAKSMVATPDGGVIILAGPQLIKYDGNLNKVKEITIEVNTEAVKAKMKEMMQNCPVCGAMKQTGTTSGTQGQM